jgi:tetratricopeptide (TPR) repeat protein
MDQIPPTDELPSTPSQQELAEGIALAKAGAKGEARAIFRRIIGHAPQNEQAWLWLAWVADTKAASRRILQEALVYLGDSEATRAALEWSADDDAAAQPPERRARKSASETLVPDSMRAAAEDLGEQVQRARYRASELGDKVGGRLGQVGTTLHGLSDCAQAWHRPTWLPDRRTIVAGGLSLGTLIALVAVIWLGIANARSQPRVTLALELPTPVVDATATPTAQQLVSPLWIQVQVAITQSNWSRVVEYLDDIRTIDPENERARKELSRAEYQVAVEQIAANQLAEAQASLNRAIQLDAEGDDLQTLRRKLALYVQGLGCYQQQDWPRAVTLLTRVYRQDPAFRDTAAMLGKSYYQVGIIKQTEEAWEDARDAYKEALRLQPELADAQTKLTEVMDILIPPHRIEVSLSDKLVRVYEDHRPIYVFSVCTGRASAPTLPGRYAIKTKMPSAYASKWDLDMPYWLGIYDAGGSENGFHALPILSNGTTLWRGSLGTGCSFGCIVLDTPNARTLYDWAELGVVVLVEP